MADTDKTLSLRIKAEAQGEKEIAALTKEVKDLKSEAAKPIPDPTDQLEKGLDESALSADALKRSLTELRDTTKTALPDPTRTLQEGTDKTTDSLKKTKQELTATNEAIGKLTDLVKGLVAIETARYFAQTADAAQKLRIGLDQVNESQEKTQKDIAFLSSVSNKFGLNLNEVGQQYVNLAAAAKGTNLEGLETQRVFEAIVGAMTTLGKSSAETDQALRAVQQIMSKGKLSAEELRGQLGEVLPGAFQIAAKAMGKTTAELDKMLEQGLIFSDEFLPKFRKALEEALKTEPVETYEASWNRFLNNLNIALATTSESGVKKFTDAMLTAGEKAILGLSGIPIILNDMATRAGVTAGALWTLTNPTEELARIGKATEQQLKDLGDRLSGVGTDAERAAEAQKKLAEKAAEAITPLQRLQDAASGGGIEKLGTAVQAAIKEIERMGGSSKAAADAIKLVLDNPTELKTRSKLLELAETVELVMQRSGSAVQLAYQGLGDQLTNLSSKQLQDLQNAAQQAIGVLNAELINAATYGKELSAETLQLQNSYSGLGTIIETTAIAALKKLGIDGVEAIKGVDAQFNEVIGALNLLADNAEITGDVLSQAFAKGIEAATTVAEIDSVRESLLQAGSAGRLSAEQIALAMVQVNEKTATVYAQLDPLTQALQRFGIDSTEAFTGLDAEMQASIQTLDVLANSARITGDVLYKAISESIDAANTVAELETLKAKVEEFGRIGELSGNQVKQAIAELNVKLQDANKGIDPLAKAFENLGVTSAKELKAIADQAQVSFDLIKNSGKATTGEIADAFVALAEKQLKAAEAQGREAEIATQLRLKAIAETGKYGEALNEIVKKFTQIEDKSKASGDAQTENIEKTTQALKEQQAQLREIEHSMVGIQAATIKVGNQMAVAFDTQGIRQFNALAQDVTNWLDQANVAIADLNGDAWNTGLSSAKSLAREMGEVSGYMDDTVKTVREDLVSAIQDATNEMRKFAEIQKDALQKAVEDLEDLKAKNNEFAQEQLRHKRELAELEKALAEAQKQRNQEAIDAITEQMRIEDERHKIIMNNLKAEQTESARFGENITNGANSARAAIDNMSVSAQTAQQSIQQLTEAGS